MTTSIEKNQVFIVGVPRSGTSILLYAIKQVFNLPGNGESHVMPAFNQMIHGLYTYLDQFSSVDRSIYNSLLLKDLSIAEAREHMLVFVRNFYNSHFPDGRWVDKTPSLSGIYSVPLVEAAFPDAKTIATTRNGIEVVTSHMKKFGSDFETACNIWSNGMRGILKVRSLCQNLIVIDQFDFSNRTDAVSSEIAGHIGESEKANALATFLANERVQNSSRHDWRRRLRLEDTTWSESQREQFVARCGEMMAEFGYATEVREPIDA